MLRKILRQGSLFALSLVVAGSLFGQAAATGTRIGLIAIQDAIVGTQEGQKITAALRAKYKPAEDDIKKQQAAIGQLRQQLQRGANTMSEDGKRRLVRDIQTKEREAKRSMEDAESEFQREFQQFQQEAFAKLRSVIKKYMNDKGLSLILDISSAQTPVVDASSELLITNDIIELFDKENPVAAAPSAAPAAAAAKPTP